MIRNAIGSLIALVGAAAAVWSTFLPWYNGRDGKDFALSDLFTAAGVSGSQPALMLGLFLPMLVAAILTVLGVLLRSRLLVALAALLTLAFALLWIVRQGIAAGSLTFGGASGLAWGVGITFASAAVMLLGALFMAGRREGRGRHRGTPDTRLRRREPRTTTGAGTRAGAGAAEVGGTRPAPSAGTRGSAGASPGEPAPRPLAGSGAEGRGGSTAGTPGTTAAGAGAGAAAGAAGAAAAARGTDSGETRQTPTTHTASGTGRGTSQEPGTTAPGPGAPHGTGSQGGRATAAGPTGEAPSRTGQAEPSVEGATTAGEPGTGASPHRPAPRSEAGDDAGETLPGEATEPDRPDAGRTAATGAAVPGEQRGTGPAEPESGTGAPESTRPMPHTQPVTGSGEEPGTGRRAGAAAGGAATGAGAGAGADRPTGAGMGDFPRDERADWGSGRKGKRPAGAGASPSEPARTAGPAEPAGSSERPLAGAGAGGSTRSSDLRAEKGPDAMRPEETRGDTAPESGRKEPLPQRLLHRLQHAGHRGHHGPRGGDHRDAA